MRGFLFIVIGVIYLINPNIFRRGLWLKTSWTIGNLSASRYNVYMRILGGILIIIGLTILYLDNPDYRL